jgi:transposase
MMNVKPVLALPEGFHLVGVEKRNDVFTVTLVSTQISPCCPLCGSAAKRIHSRYTRHVADLPCAGQSIRLLIQVRKYVCEESTCPRKIFAERLAPFVEPFVRVTKRLCQIVQIIGLATGGRLGVRVTDRLGIQTILRRIMALPPEPVGETPSIGIDDFSFRRGLKFGTIVVERVNLGRKNISNNCSGAILMKSVFILTLMGTPLTSTLNWRLASRSISRPSLCF